MIVFDLECRGVGHRFEGWFASSEAFTDQQGRGQVSCPQCGSSDVGKAVMAPNLARKGNQQSAASPAQPVAGGKMPVEAQAVLAKLAALQAEALRSSRWVGKQFADESRKIHYGETDDSVIYGEATPEQAKELLEEGIAVMPLPFPVAPPDELN